MYSTNKLAGKDIYLITGKILSFVIQAFPLREHGQNLIEYVYIH